MSFEALSEYAIRLDTILTGRHEVDTAKTALDQAALLDDAVGLAGSRKVYRLSDGGISGIVVMGDGTLRLASGSCDKVRAAWATEDAIRETAALTAALTRLVQRMAAIESVGVLNAARGVVPGR